MHPDRRLFVDACLPKRLASELVKRGRIAQSAAEHGVDRMKDPILLRWLSEKWAAADFVVVTGDDKMPGEHGELIRDYGLTVATVDGQWFPICPDPAADGNQGQNHWKHEVVHRWAQVISAQEVGSVVRYSFNTHRRWTPRRK